VEKSQQQAAGAVGDAHKQRAAAAERDVGELDDALDDCVVAMMQRADRRDARAVLVARGEVEQQVLHGFDAEPRELLGDGRADAAELGQRQRGGVRHRQPRVSTMTASTSTSAPFGSAATPIAARAGYGSARYDAMTSFTVAKLPRSVRYTLNFTTSA